MILDSEEILKAVTLAKVKGTIATLVWNMQLENFNAEILDVVAEDLYSKLNKIEDPTELDCVSWQAELEQECERYLCHDTAPALSIVPWFDKLTSQDYQIISVMGLGGYRHSVLHVRMAVTLMKDKILKGAVLSKIATSGNLKGSLEWFVTAKEIKKGAPDIKILEVLRNAVAYEVEAINR